MFDKDRWIKVSNNEDCMELSISDRFEKLGALFLDDTPFIYQLVVKEGSNSILREIGIVDLLPPSPYSAELYSPKQPTASRIPSFFIRRGASSIVQDFQLELDECTEVLYRIDKQPVVQNFGSAHSLIGSIVTPYCDILCFFSDDYENSDAIAEEINKTVRGLRYAVVWGDVKPAVVIIEQRGPSLNGFKFTTRQISRALDRDWERYIASIQVYHMKKDGKCLEELMQHINLISTEMQKRRNQLNISFTTRQILGLIELTCQHRATRTDSPFDLYLATRSPKTPLMGDFAQDIQQILCHIRNSGGPMQYAWSAVALRLFMNHCHLSANLFDTGKALSSE
jgi:hypothetical protein